jgi:HPt (histidine-containing phosphotransfer) domain-containing protein
MSDLAGAMDRIQALEEQNEQAYLENQRLVSDIHALKKDLSQ